jgi:hypothetical protein
VTITRPQAELAIQALMPKVQALEDMLHLQIKTLPPGCDDWVHTRRILTRYQETVRALQGVNR